ncbi:MAG: hypothetical protein V2I33_01675 [Kangiellaceae bacterium]|jgi:hypothetical protein|nr:hypothetical protein [Kangiellaceae bacterium]
MKSYTDVDLIKYFENKVVSFSTVDNTLALKEITLELMCNRLFVVGTIPVGATSNDWAINRPSAVAWDSVVDFMIFDSETQYQQLLNKS